MGLFLGDEIVDSPYFLLLVYLFCFVLFFLPWACVVCEGKHI